jgi:hypothetical protein
MLHEYLSKTSSENKITIQMDLERKIIMCTPPNKTFNQKTRLVKYHSDFLGQFRFSISFYWNEQGYSAWLTNLITW